MSNLPTGYKHQLLQEMGEKGKPKIKQRKNQLQVISRELAIKQLEPKEVMQEKDKIFTHLTGLLPKMSMQMKSEKKDMR
jgi:hypothetical protein